MLYLNHHLHLEHHRQRQNRDHREVERRRLLNSLRQQDHKGNRLVLALGNGLVALGLRLQKRGQPAQVRRPARQA